jgi:tetratricopeptide (TPR) repeat protein
MTTNAAESILTEAQQQRFIIEDFRPLAESLEWDLGQRYLRERGSKAFLSDTSPVPFVINNDGVLSRQAAELLFASLVESEKAGPLEPRIFVLELGIGVGLFARFFLDAFKELCARKAKDFYRRLTYVAGDRSERMLADACRHGVFANHAGHYLIRVVDAMDPRSYLIGDPSIPGEQPLRAVFLNYLLDCLPAADLKIRDAEVSQLCVRTCLARNLYLAEYTRLSPQDLARQARSASAADQRSLLELYGLFASEYDYRPVSGQWPVVSGQSTRDGGPIGEPVAEFARIQTEPTGALDPGQASVMNAAGPAGQVSQEIPYLDFAVQFARDRTNHLLHNYGAIRSLEWLLTLLQPGGFILASDYGQTEITREEGFEHQRFSHATFVGINFPLLKAYFADGGRCQWAEPKEDNGRIHSRLLGAKLGAETTTLFTERFSKAANDWLQEPVTLARANLQHGRIEAALAAYHRALERQPYNWILMNEVAMFLTFTLHSPAAGIKMAKAAIDLNPNCSAELWNTLGDAWYEVGKVAEAKGAYQRALRINPSDIRGRYNLAWVLNFERRYRQALAIIAEALAMDETGEYHEQRGV